jgi:hypothetical protein
LESIWDMPVIQGLVRQFPSAVECRVGDGRASSWRAVICDPQDSLVDARIESTLTGKEVAWLPVSIHKIASHPSGIIWAGTGHPASHLYLFTMEGESSGPS